MLTDDEIKRIFASLVGGDAMSFARAIEAATLASSSAAREDARLSNGDFALALNVRHAKCHEAADAFWAHWKANGETHKRGYYESTWGAINRALRLVGTCEHFYGEDAARSATKGEGAG